MNVCCRCKLQINALRRQRLSWWEKSFLLFFSPSLPVLTKYKPLLTIFFTFAFCASICFTFLAGKQGSKPVKLVFFLHHLSKQSLVSPARHVMLFDKSSTHDVTRLFSVGDGRVPALWFLPEPVFVVAGTRAQAQHGSVSQSLEVCAALARPGDTAANIRAWSEQIFIRAALWSPHQADSLKNISVETVCVLTGSAYRTSCSQSHAMTLVLVLLTSKISHF